MPSTHKFVAASTVGAVLLLASGCSDPNQSRFRYEAFELECKFPVASISFLEISICLPSRLLTANFAVQGLFAFKQSVQDPAGVLESWNAESPPCSTSDCSSTRTAQDCNWAGIACQDWQIMAVAMPCTVLSDGSTTGWALHWTH